MLLRLQQYDFELTYVPGLQLVLADTLSRAPPLQSATAADVNIQSLTKLAALTDKQLLGDGGFTEYDKCDPQSRN